MPVHGPAGVRKSRSCRMSDVSATPPRDRFGLPSEAIPTTLPTQDLVIPAGTAGRGHDRGRPLSPPHVPPVYPGFRAGVV